MKSWTQHILDCIPFETFQERNRVGWGKAGDWEFLFAKNYRAHGDKIHFFPIGIGKAKLIRCRSSPKEHVKIIFIPVIALSFPHFCPKLEQTLHIHQGQHSRHAGDIFVFKRCIKIPKNAMLYVRVVSDEP